jgi:phage/plasmid primase-like uncharacterized protein
MKAKRSGNETKKKKMKAAGDDNKKRQKERARNRLVIYAKLRERMNFLISKQRGHKKFTLSRAI